MATRMPRRLVALSFAAIATIYSTGYLATQGADSRIAQTESATIAPLTVPAAPTLVPTLVPTPAAPAISARGVPTPIASRPATPASSAAAPVVSTAYRDGTYEG